MSDITLTPRDLPITRVTLFEDRGEIMRRGVVTLPAGPARITLKGVTPLLVDRLVSAWFDATTAAHVEDIHIQRRWVARGELPTAQDEARLAALAEEIKGAEYTLEVARQRYSRALQQRTATATLLSRYTRQVGRALWTDQGEPDQWSAAVAQLTAALTEADSKLHSARQDQWQAEEAVERLHDLVDSSRDQQQTPVADVTLQITGEGGELPLCLSAVVPCALWRPSHEAHLIEGEGGPQIQWRTFATVWQRTGEDWSGVELILSTARPSAGAHLPPLRPDRLHTRLKSVEERRAITVAHRVQAIERDTAAAPGVDDGGEIRVLTPEAREDIPSDGRPHRVAVGGFTEGAEVDLVTRPEVATYVYSRATTVNPMSTPLLAGPVVLIRGGAYVGTGDLGYVGPKERFELSFGSDDRFTVRHKRRRITEDRMLVSNRTHFVHEVELSSTGAGLAEVNLVLRLPVSELKQVKVIPSHTSEGVPAPDADGLVTVPVALRPGGHREITAGFYFELQGQVRLPDPW